jgi:hypothetical protein
MASSGILRRVDLVIVDVSEELRSSIRVIRIGELGTTLAWYFFVAYVGW